MKTIMMQFATGPTNENAGGVFIGNAAGIFIGKRYETFIQQGFTPARPSAVAFGR
jgi:hypothetical protein